MPSLSGLSAGEAGVPLRSHIEVSKHHGRLLRMPWCHPASAALSLKAVTVFDDNPARGLPRIQALATFCDGTTGQALAIMDGASLTALLTGAASGAATELLARREACTVAVLRAGAQGRTYLEAMCAVRTIQKAWVFDAHPPAAETYARVRNAATGVTIVATANVAEAVRAADIICAATVTKTPGLIRLNSDLPPELNARYFRADRLLGAPAIAFRTPPKPCPRWVVRKPWSAYNAGVKVPTKETTLTPGPGLRNAQRPREMSGGVAPPSGAIRRQRPAFASRSQITKP